MDLDEELLNLAGAKKHATKRPVHAGKKPMKRLYHSDDEEESSAASSSSAEFDDLSSEEEEEEEEEGYDLDDSDKESVLSDGQLNQMSMVERESYIAQQEQKKRQKVERQNLRERLQAGTKKKTRSRQKSVNKDLDEFKKKRERKLQGKSNKLPGYETKPRFEKVQRPPPSFEELEQIRVGRTQLEKWVYAPFFEDAVHNCFVRLGVGVDQQSKKAVYRVAQVVEVTEYHRKYNLDKTPCKTALKLRHGKSEKVFLMDVISNAPFTQSEYDRWVVTMKSQDANFPSVSEIDRCKKQLEDATTHVFTNTEIDMMIQQKQAVSGGGNNLIMQKMRMVAQRDEALTSDNQELAAQLNDQIAQLTAHMDDPESAGMPFIADQPVAKKRKDVWAHLNERNRRKNQEEGVLAEELIRKQRAEQTTKQGDPFARIKANKNRIKGKVVNPSSSSDVEVVPDQVKPVSKATTFNDALQDIDIDIDI